MELSDEEKSILSRTIDRLNTALGRINGTVKDFELPHHYDELCDLINRQKEAIWHLRAGRELGCELDSLKPTPKLMNEPHLRNEAFLAEKAKKFTREDQQENYYDQFDAGMSDLRSTLRDAFHAHMHLEHIIAAHKKDPERFALTTSGAARGV